MKKIILIALIFCGFVGTSQIPIAELSFNQNIFPAEKVQLSINSNLLLAGELLQYKAHSVNAQNRPSKLSKIVYVSLRNQNDSVVFFHKLKIDNGTANGDFFIPSSLKTGIYNLIGYTTFSRNNPTQAFVKKHIYIINPFIKSPKPQGREGDTAKIAINHKNIDALEFLPNSDVFSLNTNNATYGFREKVILNIAKKTENAKGNFCLSVRKIEPLEISEKASFDGMQQSSEIFYMPEIRGEIISGTVYSIEDTPVANKEVSLTIPGKDYIFKLAKTNSHGRFFFSVHENYSAENSVIQLNEPQEDTANLKVVLDGKALKIGESIEPPIEIDPFLKNWLSERTAQIQIENAYFDVKKDSIFKEKQNPKFFDNLGTVFLLDDYTRFPTVRETFVEVITLAAIRGTGLNAKFVVNNEYDPSGSAKFNELNPLVLVDGMQILNNADLINYNAKEINSIRVINTPYRYGAQIFSGIIAVETKQGNFVPSPNKSSVFEVDLPPAVKRKQYYTPDYTSATELSRIPDYRVQLYWNPSINLEENNTSKSFFTSDVAGIYEILLEGFTNEGIYVSDKSYFTVSDNP